MADDRDRPRTPYRRLVEGRLARGGGVAARPAAAVLQGLRQIPVVERGHWLDPGFAEYAGHMADALGDVVAGWITARGSSSGHDHVQAPLSLS